MVALSHQRRAVVKKCLAKVYNVLLDEVHALVEEEKNRRKRLWVRDWIARRDRLGASSLLLKELAVEDTKEYAMYLRMTPEKFENLLDMVAPRIKKEDIHMRDAIPARLKLEITLNVLATGNSYCSLQHFFRVSKPSISIFVPEVCDAIFDSLREFIKVPRSHEEWETISNGFQDRWNFPRCCGAIDGKHVLINAPDEGSEFYNYKGTNSVVLMAVADYKYGISYFEVGNKGSESDARVFQNCSLLEPLENGLLPNGSYFVGDDAFPLKPYLMKPYTNHNRPLTREERIFNYRLSRARRIIENVFGILVSRFRVFDRKLVVKLERVNKLVSAACALHNWLAITSRATYLPRNAIDEENVATGEIIPGNWRSQIQELRSLEKYGGHRTTNLSKKMRDRLKEYFSGEGAVSWQYTASAGTLQE